MMELVTGGSGSGKSAYAEDTLCSLSSLTDCGPGKVTDGQPDRRRYYIATMPPLDQETEKKIERHRAMRSGRGFHTLEWYTDLAGKLEREECVSLGRADILVECLSNLTANEMYMEGRTGENAAVSVIRGILCLRERCRNLVVVTSDVFSESAEDSSGMRLYKENLGRINRVLAKEADRVTEVVCGIPCAVKKGIGPGSRMTEKGKDGERGVRIITGGAFQGKRAFAESLYPGVEWTDGGRCAPDEIRTCRAVYSFHEFVKRWLRQGKSWEELASLILEKNRELILICDEIGCGLVPVDAFEREYRESTGRIMNALAEQAERVDRVVCGIGRRIK